MEFAMEDLEIKSTDLRGSSLGLHLVGVWNLRNYTNIHKGGREVQPFGASPVGLLVYTSNGFVSAQLMDPRRRPSQSGDWDNRTPEEYQEFGNGYIGYCGHYEIDENHATVTHLPSVAFVPNLVGQRLLRQVALEDNRLTLKASYTLADGSSATSLLEWSRIISKVEQS